MSDLHVDDFFKDIARILNQLYLGFPRKATLYVEDIAGPDEPDEFGLHSDRHMSCLGALVWLAEEGYIRYADTIRQEAVDQVVLAGRTFSALSATVAAGPDDLPEPLRSTAAEGFGTAVPDSVIREAGTRINRMRDALRSRSSDRLRGVVLELLEAARP